MTTVGHATTSLIGLLCAGCDTLPAGRPERTAMHACAERRGAARGASGRVGDAEVQCQNRCTLHATPCYAHASTWRVAAATTSSRAAKPRKGWMPMRASPCNWRTRRLPRPGTGRRRSVNPGHLALALLFFPPGGFQVIVRVTREVRSNELSEGDGKQGSQKRPPHSAGLNLVREPAAFNRRKSDPTLKTGRMAQVSEEGFS